MSDETKSNLEACIEAHMQDEGLPGMLEHWVVVAGSLVPDDTGRVEAHAVWTDVKDGQADYVSDGLLHAAAAGGFEGED